MIYSGLYILGGCLGFLPPTVFSGDYADYVRFFDREVVEMLVALRGGFRWLPLPRVI